MRECREEVEEGRVTHMGFPNIARTHQKGIDEFVFIKYILSSLVLKFVKAVLLAAAVG